MGQAASRAERDYKMAVEVRGKDEDEYQRPLSDLAACGSAHKPAGLSIIGNRCLPKGPLNPLGGGLVGVGGPLLPPMRSSNQPGPLFFF